MGVKRRRVNTYLVNHEKLPPPYWKKIFALKAALEMVAPPPSGKPYEYVVWVDDDMIPGAPSIGMIGTG